MIDVQAGEVQFVDHLAPVYLALPPEQRGEFITQHGIRDRVEGWGIHGAPRIADMDRPVVVASYGDQKRARRQGRKQIVRLEHGAGQSYWGDSRFAGNASYAGGRDCQDVGLFLCPNEQSADRWRDVYPAADVEVVGCPKLDLLPTRGEGPLTVAISFHFNIPIIPETFWAWPSYRFALPALAERFKVIAHAHPKAMPFIERHYRRADIEIVQNFAEVCERADVYACDNSSTLFEFAATGRPVVPLNSPDYRRSVSHGGRFWDWATVGLQCERPGDLIATIERALDDPPEVRAERERIVSLVYPVRGAAQRAADAILAWTGAAREVAA